MSTASFLETPWPSTPRSVSQRLAGERPLERPALARFTWPALCAVATAAAVLPLWVSDYLPFQDAPQHLAQIRVLADFASPAYAFQRWFELDFHQSQYLGFYLPAALLAKLVGPSAACRLVLSLIAIALPASTWMLLGSLGRDRRLAVFAPALFHSSVLYIGFFNFFACVPATIAVVALLERELQAPCTQRAVLLAFATLGVLYLHPTGVGVAVGSALVLGATAGVPLRRIARAMLPLAPAVATLGFWGLHSSAPLPTNLLGAPARPHAEWQSPLQQLRDAGTLGNVLPGRVDEVFVLLLVGLCVALAFLPGPRQRIARAWRVRALALSLIAVYFGSPIGLGYVWYIHLRALPFIALFLLAVPVLAQRRLTSALLAAAVALQVAYAGKLVSAYRAFDAEVGPAQFEQVLRAAQPGRRLIGLMFDRQSDAVHFEAFMHFGMYYELERGGRARFNFAELPWMPIHFRRDRPPEPMPRNWEWRPEEFDWASDAQDADYILVRGPFEAPDLKFALLAQAGRWALYEHAAGSASGAVQAARPDATPSARREAVPLRAPARTGGDLAAGAHKDGKSSAQPSPSATAANPGMD